MGCHIADQSKFRRPKLLTEQQAQIVILCSLGGGLEKAAVEFQIDVCCWPNVVGINAGVAKYTVRIAPV